MFGKYKYTENEEKELLNSIVILVDTREKVNDHIIQYFEKHEIPYKKKALKNGDYSFYVPKNEKLGIFRDTYFNDEIDTWEDFGHDFLDNYYSNYYEESL